MHIITYHINIRKISVSKLFSEYLAPKHLCLMLNAYRHFRSKKWILWWLILCINFVGLRVVKYLDNSLNTFSTCVYEGVNQKRLHSVSKLSKASGSPVPNMDGHLLCKGELLLWLLQETPERPRRILPRPLQGEPVPTLTGDQSSFRDHCPQAEPTLQPPCCQLPAMLPRWS